MDYFGQVDFTLMCRLWKEHKELFQMVDFRDGQHAILKVNFNERQQPDEHGNTHYLQASCKKSERKEGVNYYIGSSFKPSQNNNNQQPQQPAPPLAPQDDSDLPF